MSHNVVYLFSTSNLGNYQADMTISHLALTQSTLLKYFQKIIIKLHPLSTRAVIRNSLYTECTLY